MYYAIIVEDRWTHQKSIYITKTNKYNNITKRAFKNHKDYKFIEEIKIDKIGIL